MKKVLFFSGVLILSLKAFSHNTFPSLDIKSIIHQDYQSFSFLNTKSSDPNWDKLLNRIKLNGKLLQTEFNDFLFLGEPIPNDTTKSRVASYVSAVGYIMNETDFLLERIDFVWESWVLQQDNIFSIEQWVFSFKPNGQLIFEEKRQLKIGLDSIIHSAEKVEETTPDELKEKRNLILQSWFEPNSM